MPGEQGNFTVAADRQTHGQVFWDSDKPVDGDYLLGSDPRGLLQLPVPQHGDRPVKIECASAGSART